MMAHSWKTEEEEAPQQSAPLPQKRPAASIVLLNSDSGNHGVLLYLDNPYSWRPGDPVGKDNSQPVGTWTRSPIDDHIHIFLERPIDAIQDQLVQTLLGIQRQREHGLSAAQARARSYKRGNQQEQPAQEKPANTEVQDRITSIRSMFKGD